ncbi:MAG: hypothetical protein M3N51_12210, partial [Actinomycetota bacterium]|nr:hypothetical protein [Actinomycetota bacterium]
MRRPPPTLAALAFLSVYALAMGGALVLSILNGNLGQNPEEGIPLLLAFTALVLVGALVVARVPGNSVGWIFSAVGLLLAVGYLAQEYAEFGYLTRPGSLPVPLVAVWVTSWYWLLLLGLTFVFVPLLFPTGRLPSRGWRPVAWVGGAGTAAVTVLAALNPRLQLHDEEFSVPNPIGVEAVGNVEETALGSVFFVLLLVAMAAAIISQLFRFRHSRGAERQQLKWFTYAGVLLLTMVLVVELFEEQLTSIPGGDAVFGLVIGFLPVSAGIAILRYRLYDIDLVINRTLVYGSLTLLLVAVYAAGVVLLPRLL